MAISTGFIISLSPTHLSAIAVRRGRVQQAETTRLDPNEWRGHWNDGLMRLDQPLRQLLSRFSNVSRHGVTLIYQSPTLTTQVTSAEQSGAVARETARSKIREVVGLDASVCVCELGNEHGANSKSILLAYSDRDETLRAFYAWLNRCGVRVTGMIPSSVVSVLIACDQSIAQPGDTAVYYLDKHSSVISYADSDGRLLLVRPADIGFETLTDSYRQVLSEYAKQMNQPMDQPFDQIAQEYLFEHGVPYQVHQCGGLELRSSVLPRMAPVLQRMGIDLKQTIRFGINDPYAVKNLVVLGPGGAIPMVTKAIGEHLDLHVSASSGCDQFDPSCAGSPGSTEHAYIKLNSAVPALLPRIADEERSRNQLKQAMAAGIAFAGLVMGGQYMLASKEISETERSMLADASRYDQVVAFENASVEVHQTQTMLAQIANLVATHSSNSACWESPLSGLGLIIGDGIRIQEIRGEFDDKSPVLKVNGYSVASEGKMPGQVLDEFVADLGNMKQVLAVQLGATTRIEISNNYLDEGGETEWGSQFSLTVSLETHASPYESIAQVPSMNDWIQP